MKTERASGILLHVTSLPGKYGIGTLGNEAFHFVDMLKKGGQQYWQILPIGPVSSSMGYSPYASTSTFAGNHLWISLEKLKENKWFRQDIDTAVFEEDDFVNFETVSEHKFALLQAASEGFFSRATRKEISLFNKFCKNEQFWLEDYCLYTALAEHFNTNNWLEWEKPISKRRPGAVKSWSAKLQDRIELHKFIQYVFYKQWSELKKYCRRSQIKIIGDIPFYITLDSADAWSHPEILQLHEDSGRPEAVAGVPPDYFSETGQRWGNPLYRWLNGDNRLHAKTLLWWVRRIKHINELVDFIRVDHFRAFETYWSIPADQKTATKGKWIKGPGGAFFHKLRDALGDLPLIAEDLGDITPAVEKLRDDLGLAGMKVLQFAFDFNNRNYYLPHTIRQPNCIVYTGTHDNNTTNGWFYGPEIDDSTRAHVLEYMGADNYSDFHWHLIRLAFSSIAGLVILPAQDVLGYGSEFRMNIPGTAENNWRWKLKVNSFNEELMLRLKNMGYMYDRVRNNDGQPWKQ
jgi:4-alpha-glucanotransferase